MNQYEYSKGKIPPMENNQLLNRRDHSCLCFPIPLTGQAGVGNEGHPYAGLLYFHFLLAGLAEQGHIS